MPLKFQDASPYRNKTPKQIYIDDFQNLISEYFYTSSDWYTIQEQSDIGSDIYSEVDVRITHAVNAEYGLIQNDDYKIILFEDLQHPIKLGQYYRFDDNYWIVVNVEALKSLTSSCAVRRCNNVLRWLDVNGSLYECPVAITEAIKENRDYATVGSALVSPSGILEFTTQLNTKTARIRPNQRFLFGGYIGGFPNWTAWKIQGGGINNYNNLKTSDNSTATLLRLTAVVNYINEDTDDLVNGVPDRFQYNYVFTLNKPSMNLQVNDTSLLLATLKLNDEIITKDVVWSTDNDDVAVVSTSGVVTAVAAGSCKIRVSLANNLAVYAECDVTAVATPVTPPRQIRLSPNRNYVYEGTSQTFVATLYVDDVASADVVNFSVTNTGVPTDKYSFAAAGSNDFIITNHEKYLLADVRVHCVSGATTADFDIKLKGAW